MHAHVCRHTIIGFPSLSNHLWFRWHISAGSAGQHGTACSVRPRVALNGRSALLEGKLVFRNSSFLC